MHNITSGSKQHGILPKHLQCCKISKEKPQEVTLDKTPPSYLHLQAVIYLEPCTEFSGKTQQLTGVRMGLGC